MPNFNSIKFRLLVVGVILVVAGVASRIFILNPFVREQIYQLVAAQESTIANYVARDVDHSIRSRLALLGKYSEELTPGLVGQPERLQAWVKARQQINPLFDGILVITPDGLDVLAEYPKVPGRETLDYAHSDWFLEAKLRNKPVMGKPMHGRVSGAPLIVMAAAVRDAAGNIVAVLCGASLLNSPGFLDGLQKIHFGVSGGFLLISPSDRMFVASTDPSMVMTATPPDGVDPLHDRAMKGFRGTGMTVNSRGVEEISTMVTVPSTGWFVVAGMPTEEAFRPAAVFREYTLKTGVIILIVMVSLITALLTILLRPLVHAARAMRDMADGKRELSQLAIHRNDEVGDLLLGFNHLVEKLQDKEAALQTAVKRLEQLAGTDALTGSWNRRQFDEVVDRELDRSRRYGHPISIMLLDLDYFKLINDKYGHLEGDRVLQLVANRIREALRKSDSLTRWGGEEFMVLMPDTGLANATVLAERVRTSIGLHSIENIGSVTVSIGVAKFVVSESRDQWVERADAALYRAKHAGRNRVEVDAAPKEALSPEDFKEVGAAQLVWSDRYCSGNTSLDTQHKELFDGSNVLLSAILSERAGDDVGAAVDKLMRDLASHFQYEVKLLFALGYPHAAAHAALHKELIHSAAAQVEQFHSGSLNVAELFQFFARDLIVKHILSEDREFFPYLDQPHAASDLS